jgi:hypothetical protein
MRCRSLLAYLAFLMFALEACDARISSSPDIGARDASLRMDSAASAVDGAFEDGSNDASGAAAIDAFTRRIDGGPACVDDCGPCVENDELTDFEQMLINLAPQTWFEAPNSHMRTVCAPDTLGVSAIVGCTGVVAAWSSGAYDSTRRRMLVWGGGHNDYWGNEIYGFDLRTGTWSRVTEPSTVPSGTSAGDFVNRDPLPNGQPVSRHTYDGVEFISDLGLLWAHGGSRAADGGHTAATWLFDASSGWTQRSDGYGGYQLGSAYDSASRRVFVFAPSGLVSYDVESDSWSAGDRAWGFPPLWPRYAAGGDRNAVIDPRRRLYWLVGGFCREPDRCRGTALVWDIDRNVDVTDEWNTTGGGVYTNIDIVRDYPEQLMEGGGGAIYNVPAPGIDYDSVADDLVAWPNAGAPYALDLETKEWTLGGDIGAPVSRNSGGTFGRWRYVAAYNVFILVNSVDENVYFYKHTSGCGPG